MLAQLRGAAGPVGITELARRLAVHPNTVRFHLDALQRAGLVRRVDSAGGVPGRPAVLFTVVPGMDRGGARRFGELAAALVAALDGVPDGPERARRAGRAWGRDVAERWSDGDVARRADGGRDGDSAAKAVARLTGLLAELDFDPVPLGPTDPDGAAAAGAEAPHAGPLRIGLRRCPFLEVATTSTALVCPVHLGLMQGAVQAWAAPVAVERLDPFATPELCVAHLTADAVGT